MKNAYEEGFKVTSARKAAERERLREQVRKLRREGLTYKLIAERLGCSESRVKLLESNAKWRESPCPAK